jgi:hypothetical protein
MKNLKKIIIALFLGLMIIAAYTVTVPGSMAPKPMVEDTRSGKAPPPPPVLEAKISVANLIDIEWSEGNSWSTVWKLLVIVLGIFLGIKTINAIFKKFE